MSKGYSEVHAVWRNRRDKSEHCGGPGLLFSLSEVHKAFVMHLFIYRVATSPWLVHMFIFVGFESSCRS